MKHLLLIALLALSGCASTPDPDEDKCLQVYKDQDGVMKYKYVDCLDLLRRYQDIKK